MATTAQEWPNSAPDYASLAAAVQGEAARWNVPGMTAAVFHDGERAVIATGVSNLEYPVPVTPDTRFQIGSISKVFTATAIMALVDKDKLDLDTPVTKWVPELPLKRTAGVETLTLRHLLNHTTGFEGDMFFDTGNGDDALAEGIKRFATIRQWTMPGEIHAYCNTGFYLAGRIIEVTTGKTYEDAVTELVVKPLGLEQTGFASADLVTWPTASGHTLQDRERGLKVCRPWALPRVVNSAGGVVSTVGDLLTFAEMHMNGGVSGETRVISEEYAAAMRQRTSCVGVMEKGFGIGWMLNTIEGVDTIARGGATYGFHAMLATVPERGFALAMLTNGDTGMSAMNQVQRWALKHYLDLNTPQREVIEADEAMLDAVTGHYERHDSTIDIWRVDGHLHIERRVVEHEDRLGSEGSEDDPPTVISAHPTGDGVFRVMEGPFHDMLVEFFDGQLFGEDDDALVTRQIARVGGRLSERTGAAPASGPTHPAM